MSVTASTGVSGPQRHRSPELLGSPKSGGQDPGHSSVSRWHCTQMPFLDELLEHDWTRHDACGLQLYGSQTLDLSMSRLHL